jgi:hypothetical protein
VPIAGGERQVGCPKNAEASIHDGFGYVISVKENVPDLLCRALSLVTMMGVDACDYFRFILAWGITNRAVKAKGICAL